MHHVIILILKAPLKKKKSSLVSLSCVVTDCTSTALSLKGKHLVRCCYFRLIFQGGMWAGARLDFGKSSLLNKMFSVFCKLSFKSSRISVAIVFHRKLLGDKVFACLVRCLGWESQTVWCQAGGLRVFQWHLVRSRALLCWHPLPCPVFFDSSLLCKLSSFQCVVSETYCNKEEIF